MAEKCSATTAKGKPCKRNALEGTDPPLCVSHVGAVGRKSKLTDEVVERVLLMLRGGNYVETAVAAAGISRSTFYEWLERGDPEGTAEEDAPYRDFRERVEKARAEGEGRLVALVAKAAPKDWKAASWLLERQHPERWARPMARQGDDDKSPPADPESPAGPQDRMSELEQGGAVIPIRRSGSA